MDQTILIYTACILFIIIFGKIFFVPLSKLFKLILNSVLGGVLIFVINLIGNQFSFHIGLNIITTLVVGILGVPGAIMLVVLKFLTG